MLHVPSNLEINEQFSKALDLIEKSNKSVFITGRAGTGKSTLLSYFRNTTKKNIAVLAPTGVAAVNIDGQTIHSFFGFRPDVTVEKIKKNKWHDEKTYKAIDIIIIDEISMVRADLLDCVDKFLRIIRGNKMPFGGVQMIFIGDLYQLPPVVISKEREIFIKHYKSQYFFDAKVLENFKMEFIELEKIYRQKDKKFISILNSIRNKSATDMDIQEINKRVLIDFHPPKDKFYINLTTTNDLADQINYSELSKIKTNPYTYTGKLNGLFDKSFLPTEINLTIKQDAQVMLLNNDSRGRWVNGTVGKIVGIRNFRQENDTIIVETQNGNVEVEPYTWKIFNLMYNNDTGTINSETIGSFTQYPIKLAWAITIHKGQGKTFDNVIIDIGKGAFTHGQVYVALSRCTSLDGIILKKPIQKKHIWMDWRVVKFLTRYQYDLSEKNISIHDKIKIIENAIKNRSKLNIIYLKSNDQKSSRLIQPKKVEKMEYMGRQYIGLEAYCFSRKDDRIFRVDKILEINEA